MSHTPNGSILPCVRAFNNTCINLGYAVNTNLPTLHSIRPATKHDARDGKAQRRRYAHVRNCIFMLASQKYMKQV